MASGYIKIQELVWDGLANMNFEKEKGMICKAGQDIMT